MRSADYRRRIVRLGLQGALAEGALRSPPCYDRFVVTASADRPESIGYCDFALGSFGIETPLKEGARRVICDDWQKLKSAW